MTGAGAAVVAENSRHHRVLFISALVAINTCSSIDRVATITIGPAIKQGLSLSDFQFGLIAGFGFAVFYALLGLPIARYADRHNRVTLIGVAIGLWSVFLVLSGFARNFVQLMLCRVAVGIGEAGVQPPSVSLASDFYPPRRRGFALGLLGLGVPFGTLIGAVGGGYLAEFLSWRDTFIIMGIPGFVLAAMVLLLLRDPPRGLSEQGAAGGDTATPPLAAVAWHMASKRSFWHLVAGIGIANIAVNGLGAFLPQYFARVSHLALGQVGVVYGIIGAAATLIGYFFGGVVVDWISRRDRRWYVWLSALGCLASTPLYILSFLTTDPVLATLLLTAASVAIFLYYTPTQTVLQNMATPRMRATVAFIFFFVVGIVGVGLGPALVGVLSDAFGARSFSAGNYAVLCGGSHGTLTKACEAASSTGLQTSMIVVACLGLWAALHFLLAARSVVADMGEIADGS